VLPLYSDDAVLWGTFVTDADAPIAQPCGLFRDGPLRFFPVSKVTFGDQLIRVYGGTAVNTGYYTFSYVKDGEAKSLPRATASLTSRSATPG